MRFRMRIATWSTPPERMRKRDRADRKTKPASHCRRRRDTLPAIPSHARATHPPSRIDLRFAVPVARPSSPTCVAKSLSVDWTPQPRTQKHSERRVLDQSAPSQTPVRSIPVLGHEISKHAKPARKSWSRVEIALLGIEHCQISITACGSARAGAPWLIEFAGRVLQDACAAVEGFGIARDMPLAVLGQKSECANGDVLAFQPVGVSTVLDVRHERLMVIDNASEY